MKVGLRWRAVAGIILGVSGFAGVGEGLVDATRVWKPSLTTVDLMVVGSSTNLVAGIGHLRPLLKMRFDGFVEHLAGNWSTYRF